MSSFLRKDEVSKIKNLGFFFIWQKFQSSIFKNRHKNVDFLGPRPWKISLINFRYKTPNHQKTNFPTKFRPEAISSEFGAIFLKKHFWDFLISAVICLEKVKIRCTFRLKSQTRFSRRACKMSMGGPRPKFLRVGVFYWKFAKTIFAVGDLKNRRFWAYF